MRFHANAMNGNRRTVRDAITHDGSSRPIATFSPGHKLEQHSNGLRILANDGAVVASFNGRDQQYRATTDAEGRVSVFREQLHSRRVADEALPQEPQLAAINKANREFYSRCTREEKR